MDKTSECKHGLKHGCVYCHARPTSTSTPTARPVAKRTSRAGRLAEQMNDRMTNLKKRLREIRGE